MSPNFLAVRYVFPLMCTHLHAENLVRFFNFPQHTQQNFFSGCSCCRGLPGIRWLSTKAPVNNAAIGYLSPNILCEVENYSVEHIYNNAQFLGCNSVINCRKFTKNSEKSTNLVRPPMMKNWFVGRFLFGRDEHFCPKNPEGFFRPIGNIWICRRVGMLCK